MKATLEVPEDLVAQGGYHLIVKRPDNKVDKIERPPNTNILRVIDQQIRRTLCFPSIEYLPRLTGEASAQMEEWILLQWGREGIAVPTVEREGDKLHLSFVDGETYERILKGGYDPTAFFQVQQIFMDIREVAHKRRDYRLLALDPTFGNFIQSTAGYPVAIDPVCLCPHNISFEDLDALANVTFLQTLVRMRLPSDQIESYGTNFADGFDQSQRNSMQKMNVVPRGMLAYLKTRSGILGITDNIFDYYKIPHFHPQNVQLLNDILS